MRMDFVMIEALMRYDPKKNFFDTSAVEEMTRLALQHNSNVILVVKYIIPVSFITMIREQYGTKKHPVQRGIFAESKVCTITSILRRLWQGQLWRTSSTPLQGASLITSARAVSSWL